jgi:hypothetical protein
MLRFNALLMLACGARIKSLLKGAFSYIGFFFFSVYWLNEICYLFCVGSRGIRAEFLDGKFF